MSARAIKHVRELTAIAKGEKKEPSVDMSAAILFICIREDAEAFRCNNEACPSFAKYVREARDAGVAVFAEKVRWGRGADQGKAFWEGAVPVMFTD